MTIRRIEAGRRACACARIVCATQSRERRCAPRAGRATQSVGKTRRAPRGRARAIRERERVRERGAGRQAL